jgi:LPPG:FO 2-phospho-L-lactate transferase
MCDEPVATRVVTPEGTLDFQEYFVHRHHEDQVVGVTIDGIEAARVPGPVRQAIEWASAIVFCPSNPIVSIGPILAVPGLRDLIANRKVPRVAVSPIVGGQALRGPADRMLRGLGHEVSAFGVASLYRGVIGAMVIDELDAHLEARIEDLGMRVLVAPTIMENDADREKLASRIVELCARLRA